MTTVMLALVASAVAAELQPPPAASATFIRPVMTRRYEVRFASRDDTSVRGPAPVAYFLPDGVLHRFQPGSLRGRLWVGGVEVRDLDRRTAVLQTGPYDARQARIAIDDLAGRPDLRWQIVYEVQVANAEVDEAALARITWPKQWPAAVQPALVSTAEFPATDGLFASAVEAALATPPRLTPPYIVAKRVVGYAVTRVRAVSDRRNLLNPRLLRDLEERHRRDLLAISDFRILDPAVRIEADRSVTWYRLGAERAAAFGFGSDQDLLAVCVTTLRAAGIPARVVVGVHEIRRIVQSEGGDTLIERIEPVAWGELFLPSAGWVPFDPVEIAANGQALPLDRRWPGFGFVSELKDRVPLTYDFELRGPMPAVEIVTRAGTR